MRGSEQAISALTRRSFWFFLNIYSKVQTQNKKYAVVQRYIKNFFTSLAKLLESTPASSDNSQALLSLALAESAKLIPYVVGNRRIAKSYLNVSRGVPC